VKIDVYISSACQDGVINYIGNYHLKAIANEAKGFKDATGTGFCKEHLEKQKTDQANA
jgi:hypothetical protein